MPDIDARGLERPIGLLGREGHGDIGTGLELALVADLIAHDRHARRHDDLLLTVLVFDGDGVAFDAFHRGARSAVGHGAVGRPVPGTMALARAALGFREDVHLERLLRAVGLGHRAAADEGALLDIGERGLHHVDDLHVAGKRERELRTFPWLHSERAAVDLLDRSAQANRLGLLGEGRPDRKRSHQCCTRDPT